MEYLKNKKRIAVIGSVIAALIALCFVLTNAYNDSVKNELVGTWIRVNDDCVLDDNYSHDFLCFDKYNKYARGCLHPWSTRFRFDDYDYYKVSFRTILLSKAKVSARFKFKEEDGEKYLILKSERFNVGKFIKIRRNTEIYGITSSDVPIQSNE